ncbi:MAG: DUF5916 domain-containing protein [Ferruginibacter sp.]
MKFLKTTVFGLLGLCATGLHAQPLEKRSLTQKKITGTVKIDGDLNDEGWKDAPVADKFIQFQPTPFLPENKGNETQVYFLYNNDGIFVGGYLHENSKDSIAAELTGRDGFGNNDFIGVVFDTYRDKLNAFEYFITPLNEQWDAKISPNKNGKDEDFAWNAVWQSAVKMHSDGWSFEMFIPYSAIRFGKKKVQDWGLNIVRQRRKSGHKSFWSPMDPNVNGFLTQEGSLNGFEDIKPPVRLQLSPYISGYFNHDDNAKAGTKKNDVLFNGGMDVKYGINQAFTLDMTLIPDFGQVQTDNLTLNLSPFEQRFSENRAFFTEGTELFNKGDLFYSRRIGGQPIRYSKLNTAANEKVLSNPTKSKLVNATKISGRTQKGLGIAMLNSITKPQHAVIETAGKETRRFETDPLTNYNVFVLDQTLKNNSSISFVNTSVIRDGSDYDADVAAALFDFNDKSNTWNVGGKLSISNIITSTKTTTGYSHSLYFRKTSGQFKFSVFQDLENAKYNKSDLGYFTNNNNMSQGVNASYVWNKPKGWYNNFRLNGNFYYNRLVTPIDILNRKELMMQSAGFNFNFNAQTKKLWYMGGGINKGFAYNDFYETRDFGRVFRNKGSVGIHAWVESNEAKKFSWSASFFTGMGGVFKRTTINPTLGGKIRFSSKFSVENNIRINNNYNQVGWANTKFTGNKMTDTIIFSRRDVSSVENVFNLKYNFNNRSGLSLRARHSWTKVDPQQFYEIDIYGNPQIPTTPFTKNVNQNYNFLSVDMIYNLQFAQGSFITLAWKDIGENFQRTFEKNYFSNLGKVVTGNQFTGFSIRVIYFLDYVTFRSKMKARKPL